MGAVDMGLALATGENFGKAAASTLGTVIGGTVGTIFGPAGTIIGGMAGGMIGEAAADAISKISTKGPSIEQLHAAEMQNEAAVKQLQAARLQSGGLEPDKATYTFGTAEQFADRLKVLGLEGDKAAAALKNLYSGRESAATAAKKAADELNAKIKNLKDNNIPPDLIAKQVKPLQEQFNRAKKNLEKAQADFDAQFRKTPDVIQRSITNSLSSLSFKSIETILANKIAGIQVQAPPPAFTLPNPNAIDPWAPTPVAPAPKFQWDNKNPDNMSEVFRKPGLAKGGLGDAVASEMRMKPPGSDLVIANSSETVIPAAGGNGGGMVDFVAAFRDGLSNVAAVIRQTAQQSETKLSSGFLTLSNSFKLAQEKQTSALNKINSTLISNQMQTNSRLSKLEAKFTTPGMTGGLGGAAAGGVDAFTPIAQRYGLQMTSGYRPGDPGWHGANRARDFSNGTGPTPQMMQFAQYLASSYGANLKELIYTPLGFSIKNGQKVPPYAQGSHYNHVHVAYAMGAGNPAFFSNQKDAVSWENKFLGRGVESITTNSAELAQAGDGMMGPSWLPWNWGKLVDQERKTNKLNQTNRAIEEMVEKGYISPNNLYRQDRSSAGAAPINITAPITINQQPGQDADELASIVALKIGEAVSDARAASLFV
jgi:hypothetical protein